MSKNIKIGCIKNTGSNSTHHRDNGLGDQSIKIQLYNHTEKIFSFFNSYSIGLQSRENNTENEGEEDTGKAVPLTETAPSKAFSQSRSNEWNSFDFSNSISNFIHSI